MARTRKPKTLESHDKAPLLDNDELALTWGSDQDGFDSLDVPPSSSSALSSDIDSVKQSGRRAISGGKGLESRRRDDALSGVVSMGKSGVMLGADALLPGLGSGLGAVDSAMSIRESAKSGHGLAKESAKQAVLTGLGFVPVVGQFVGFAEGLYTTAKATMQPDKARTSEKLKAAEKLRSDCEMGLLRVADLREQLESYEGADKAKLADRLEKAEGRLQDGIAMVDAWMAKKSAKGTLPLLADDGSGSSDSADP
jgi:hypothetical protein